MKRYGLILMLFIALVSNGSAAKVRVMTIGDSTMALYDEVKNSGDKELRGWAQMLPMFFNDSVTIDDEARNGRSSKSFYKERWAGLRETLKAGDYVLIQFAHNDEKENGADTDESDPKARGTAPWGQYVKYLTKYVEECRNRGATPIFVTPIVRGSFDSDGKKLKLSSLHNLSKANDAANDTTLNYVYAMKSVAKQMNVRLIDMTNLTRQLVEQYGPEASKRLIYNKFDYTHLQARGAILIAKVFVDYLYNHNILREYIQYPKGVVVSPDAINFDTTVASVPVVKAVSLSAMSQPVEKRDFIISVSAPFSISFAADSAFTDELRYEVTGDFYRPVFVKFSPSSGKTYNSKLVLIINGEERNVLLSGTGIKANKQTKQ